MRLPTYALIAAMAIVAFTGCSGKNSNDQNSSGSTDASSTAAGSPAPDVTATAMASSGDAMTGSAGANGGGDVPTYPGATAQVSGTSSTAVNGQTASGKVLSTSDSFDDVYHWYQKNLPAGSETVHLTAPVESAAFTIHGGGKNVTSVSISTAQGKTVITVARVTSP